MAWDLSVSTFNDPGIGQGFRIVDTCPLCCRDRVLESFARSRCSDFSVTIDRDEIDRKLFGIF